MQYDFGVGRSGSIFLLGLAACASPAPRTVPRVVDGHLEHGAFVAPYAYRWFIEGEVLAARGRHEEAAMAFEAAMATPTEDVLLMTRLAEEYASSGAFRRADRTLALARQSHPDSARVALAEGRVQRSRGEDDEALASFARAAELAPTWEEPVIAMAETLAVSGHPERASAVLLTYVEATPGAQSSRARHVLIDLARRMVDIDALERVLALDPRSTPAGRALAAAELALEEDEPAMAARALAQALDTSENVALWLNALVKSGDREKAATFLASAARQPWGDAIEPVALLLDIEEADAALQLLDSRDPSPRVECARGHALLARGDYLAATMVLAQVPFGAASFEASRMALADSAIAKGRPGAGAEALSEAPHGSLAIRQKLAAFYVDEGDLRAGLRLFDPKRSVERGMLAALLERAGHFDEAAAYYASVNLLSTDRPELQARASAEQLASRGQHRGAVAILAQWASFAPDDLYARVRLVELLLADDRVDAGSEEGREALEVIGDPLLRAHLIAILEEAGVTPE